MPRPLLSEALRGHGALLRDANGERFVDELLPRDVVSRAITARMLDQDIDHVWLDATQLDHFHIRFPTIAADLEAAGLDPSVEGELLASVTSQAACGTRSVLARVASALASRSVRNTLAPRLWKRRRWPARRGTP